MRDLLRAIIQKIRLRRTFIIIRLATFSLLIPISQGALANDVKNQKINSYVVVSIKSEDEACVSVTTEEQSRCMTISVGDELLKQSVLKLRTGEATLFSLTSKKILRLNAGTHNLAFLEKANTPITEKKERISKLFNNGYRSTATVATRSGGNDDCFQDPNLEREFWAISCKLEATANRAAKSTLASSLPSVSNYLFLPEELTNEDFGTNHYIGTSQFCRKLDKKAYELAQKAFKSNETVLVLSPKGYDWEESIILPLTESCEMKLNKELKSIVKLDVDERLKPHLLFHVYKEHGLVYEASKALQSIVVN